MRNMDQIAKEYVDAVAMPEPLTKKEIAQMDVEVQRIIDGEDMSDMDYNIRFIMDDLAVDVDEIWFQLELSIRQAYQEPMKYAYKLLEHKERREGKADIFDMFLPFVDFFTGKSREYKFMATALIQIVYFEGLDEGFNEKVQRAKGYKKKAWVAINQIVVDRMMFDDLILIYTDQMCQRYR